MKVLLDSCVSATLRPPLQMAGHDVVWTGDWSQDPGDEEILAFAYVESEEVQPGIILDFDENGRMIGIEILSLSSRFAAEKLRVMQFETA